MQVVARRFTASRTCCRPSVRRPRESGRAPGLARNSASSAYSVKTSKKTALESFQNPYK